MRVVGYFLIPLLFPLNSHCDLLPMSEDELALTQGQAFIGIDQYEQDGLDFTRLNLGMDIELVMNADEIVFGEYVKALLFWNQQVFLFRRLRCFLPPIDKSA